MYLFELLENPKANQTTTQGLNISNRDGYESRKN